MSEAPDLIQSVIAWRNWTVSPSGQLLSTAQNLAWDPGPNRAVQLDGSEELPSEENEVGFHGYHDPERVKLDGFGSLFPTGGYPQVAGAFRAWGKLAVHPPGVRSEWAEPVVVVAAMGKDFYKNVMPRIVDRYGIPVVATLDEAKVFANGAGAAVPEEMWPEMPQSPRFTDQPGHIHLSTALVLKQVWSSQNIAALRRDFQR